MTVAATNNVHESGAAAAQPMLFSHGFGCDQNMWRHLTPAFEARYRVVLFDHIGSGRSDLSAYDAVRYASLQGYAEDVLEICRALDLSRVIFVGHSVSAMIGIARQFARVTFLSDNREDLARVTVPSLVLQCTADAIAPQAVGEYVHRRLANSRLVLMKATGHCPNLSAPEETTAAMQGFLCSA